MKVFRVKGGGGAGSGGGSGDGRDDRDSMGDGKAVFVSRRPSAGRPATHDGVEALRRAFGEPAEPVEQAGNPGAMADDGDDSAGRHRPDDGRGRSGARWPVRDPEASGSRPLSGHYGPPDGVDAERGEGQGFDGDRYPGTGIDGGQADDGRHGVPEEPGYGGHGRPGSRDAGGPVGGGNSSGEGAMSRPNSGWMDGLSERTRRLSDQLDAARRISRPSSELPPGHGPDAMTPEAYRGSSPRDDGHPYRHDPNGSSDRASADRDGGRPPSAPRRRNIWDIEADRASRPLSDLGPAHAPQAGPHEGRHEGRDERDGQERDGQERDGVNRDGGDTWMARARSGHSQFDPGAIGEPVGGATGGHVTPPGAFPPEAGPVSGPVTGPVSGPVMGPVSRPAWADDGPDYGAEYGAGDGSADGAADGADVPDDVALARAQVARMAQSGVPLGEGSGPGARAKTRLLGFQSRDMGLEDPTSRAGSTGTQAGPRFPVGWIIVTEGPGYGASFTLTDGVSSVGRGSDQAICLDFGDTTISRQNHASIAYDGTENRFYLGHGGKANLVRLNGRPVVSTEDLDDGAVIRIGETVMRFYALCGGDFEWQRGEDGTDTPENPGEENAHDRGV